MAKQKKSPKAKTKPAKKKAAKKSIPKKSKTTKSNKNVTRVRALKLVSDLAKKNRKLFEERKNKSKKKIVEIPQGPSHLEIQSEMKHKEFPHFLRANHEDQDLKIN